MTDPQSTRPGLRARIVSWLTAAVVLLLFCWLGFASSIFRDVFKGFGPVALPALTQFSMAYGRIAFPIFGIFAATSILWAEKVGRRQRFQALLFAALVAAWVLLVRSLLICYFGPANPVII